MKQEYTPEQQYANVAIILFANEAKKNEVDLKLSTLKVEVDLKNIVISAETINGLVMTREYDIYQVDRILVGN